ncbi:hypothetical protein LOC54_08135 [Acetobacter sp. AN02]|uniref:hypothetical protein n=1 Tax=Acetobacter sp. AN02 TaxID=2894186 RepID=UPI0024345F32|nr:hypothetical protein [Acetobacter sp. AN02]MDG6095078.1 hypothetical protein [Acetobacter sp. AN02]
MHRIVEITRLRIIDRTEGGMPEILTALGKDIRSRNRPQIFRLLQNLIGKVRPETT